MKATNIRIKASTFFLMRKLLYLWERDFQMVSDSKISEIIKKI